MGDGRTGTMMVSARRTSAVSSLPCTRAGASITTTSVSFGTRSGSCHAAMPRISGQISSRALSQAMLEPWGSKSASTTFCSLSQV